jgi:hypothetical protein
VQLRCRPIVFWKWPVEPSASQDIQLGMNIEVKVMAVAAELLSADGRSEGEGGRPTSDEGYERCAVNDHSSHLAYISTASIPTYLPTSVEIL